MQRWIKLFDGRFIDGNRVVIIGRPESFSRYDEDGNDLGIGYSVQIGTDFPRDSQIVVTGSRDEVLGVLRNLLVANPQAAVVDPNVTESTATAAA